MIALTEVFIPVRGFEDLYSVSSYGRVKVLRPRYKGVDFLSTYDKSKGYRGVCLYRDGLQRTSVKRLLAGKQKQTQGWTDLCLL